MRTLISILAITIITAFSPDWAAAEPSVLKLWPDGAPLAKGTKDGDQPTITVFPAPADKAVGTGIVICPGGGYGHLSMEKEGTEVAQWLNTLGVSAFVLKYRHSKDGYHHPVPLLDAQRAIRTVRANAQEWKINPNRIGIMGFSAGGHLASTAGTHFDDPQANPAGAEKGDPIDKVSARPDFLVLCYAVVMFGNEYTHKGSQKNLIGETPEASLVENLSNEKQVTKATPPTFLFQTTVDTVVPPENSVMFYLACRKNGVPAEMHIYQDGKHGVGLAKSVPGTNSWPDRLADWLSVRGLLTKD